MKLRKILATVAASAMALSTMAVAASANEAFLMYTDSNWGWGCWNAEEFPAGTCDVTCDGTYTVYLDSTLSTAAVEDEDTGEMVGAAASGATVFCVDIADLATDMNCGKGADGYEELTTGAEKMAFAKAAGIEIYDVAINTTSSDGTLTAILPDPDKIIYGDIEGNGKIRIEIYNAYGDTVNDAPFDTADIAFDESISVTFSISGIGAASSDAADGDASNGAVVDTDNTTDTGKDGADTGVEGIAAVAGLAVVAAGAVVLSKKRK